jgi:hypothetical protein
MREPRSQPPFTPQQLAAFERGRLTGREQRLIATIRDREALVSKEQTKNGSEKVDELADEVYRLREELARVNESRDRFRVLIKATSDKTIEVWTDPLVKVQVTCVPESRTPEEDTRARKWAFEQLPPDFQAMVNEKSEFYSVDCMSVHAFRLYQIHMDEFKLLNGLAKAIDELGKQQQTEPEPW